MLTVGTVTPYTSKSGEKAYRLENIDQADFVTVILRNVVELAFYEDNINIVADLIANKMGMSEDLKKGLRDVLNTFAKMYKDGWRSGRRDRLAEGFQRAVERCVPEAL